MLVGRGMGKEEGQPRFSWKRAGGGAGVRATAEVGICNQGDPKANGLGFRVKKNLRIVGRVRLMLLLHGAAQLRQFVWDVESSPPTPEPSTPKHNPSNPKLQSQSRAELCVRGPLGLSKPLTFLDMGLWMGAGLR